MTDTPDYYGILGVGRDATRQEIAHAYRSLMRSHHPDLDGGRAARDGPHARGDAGSKAEKPGRKGDPAPGDQLLRIMQAFNVLRDPERRAAYDRTLASAAPISIPVRKVRSAGAPSGPIIRITPVRWERGPWS